MFAVKTFIVAFAIIFVTEWLVDSWEASVTRVIAKVHEDIEASTKLGGAKFWTRVERALDRAADESSDLPPEQKQQLINDLRVIIARWRPFLEAVQDGLQKPEDRQQPAELKKR